MRILKGRMQSTVSWIVGYSNGWFCAISDIGLALLLQK